MESAFEVRFGRVLRDGRAILDDVDVDLPARSVTAVLGPGGAGKSVLLRGLAGKLGGQEGLSIEGSWQHRGMPVFAQSSTDAVHHMVQRPAHRDSSAYLGDLEDAVACAIDGKRDLLVDEAADRLAPEAKAEAARLIARTRGEVATVVVTHDVNFARAVADHVVLVTGGTTVASCSSQTFFDDPPSELARRFVQQGNCWPVAPKPPLPPHFRFILPGLLAGMGKPGLLAEVDDDLEAIAHAGIVTLITLTEKPFPLELLRPFGIQGRHFPIEDMGVPPIRTAYRLAADVDRSIERGEPVAFHCHAGLGRTGTMLAAVLILRGDDATTAISRLRATGRGYVQSRSQEMFLRRFEEECR